MTPEQQRQFSQSLAGAPHSPPLQLFNGAKADTAQRFEVYLNNVRSARVDALRQSFPAIERLLGTDYFGAAAALFVRTHPPRSAVLYRYGDQFGAFLQQLPALADMPWLAEVAQIERARIRAFHAADRQPFTLSPATAGLGRQLTMRLSWHPSLSLLHASSPAYSLWASQMHDTAAPAAEQWAPEHTLVWRQGFELRCERLSGEQSNLLALFEDGRSLAEAAAAGTRPPAAVSQDLALLLGWQCLCPA